MSHTVVGPAQETVGRPWPYRGDNDPLPVYCPRCGRPLLPYAWGSSEPYLELACAGRLQSLFRRFLRNELFFWNHYHFTVGRGSWSQFDTMTGERRRMPWSFR